ncbi:MAG: translation initiation factor IF-2 [Clostridia bacterium]|nr:translation initiation factor IF-2 [Clostridia bacterium]
MAYENIEKLSALLTDGDTAALKKAVTASEKRLGELMKKIAEVEAAAAQARAEEEARLKEEARQKEEALKAAAEAEKKAKEESKADAEKQAKKAEEKPAAPASAKAPAAARPQGEYRPAAGAPARPTFRPAAPAASRPPYTGARPAGAGARPPYGAKPQGAGARPVGGRGPAARPLPPPPPAPTQRRDTSKKFEKTYVERRPVNKRALQRQQGASIGDFDEEKSGYRKARFGKKGARKETQTIKIDHAVVTSKEIPIKVLSEKLGISAVEITKRLFKEGIMKTVNESVDYDNAAFIALELGIDLEYKPEKTAEEALFEEHGGDETENLITRAPVVTVMGHVDHGKTSLLDNIRRTNVTEGEAGGITQSIGAYTVSLGDGKDITFIDTPGHAAFTAMRARGAKVTDIVVLVVAADDGIMPQTVEAIDHAKAANVPVIVAMNKMDKPHVNPDKVKQGLMEHELVPEEWGGDVIVVPVSAKTGAGIDQLLESIWLVAEMQELKANPDRKAKGVVIEAKLDKGKGPVASVLVQNGTLRTGDYLISGMMTGKVRAMIDDKGKTVKEAGPSTAVSVLGLEDVPNAGDAIYAVEQNLMKKVQDERKVHERESMIKETQKVTLDDVFKQVAEGNIKDLNVIVKGDVQGSVEAVRSSLVKLSNEEVRVKVIHAGAGAINESDIMLADSANAIVIGFNVRPDAKAKTLAERSKVDVRSYRIIYELLDDMQAALKGMLAPKYHEVYMGKAEVRQTFNITGVGVVAGCLVTEGKLIRGGKLRIYRDDVMIVEGNVKQLKHYKDDAKEIAAGLECGCAIENFNEIKIGDFIECYLIEELKQA